MATIRCRSLIIHDGKLLVVKHTGADYYCLPGGKLDPGETIDACVAREIFEELGIKPIIGQIAFFQDFGTDDKYSIDFFYTITNSQDFLDLTTTKASHAFELAEIHWLPLTDTTSKVLPSTLLPVLLTSDLQQDHHIQRLVDPT